MYQKYTTEAVVLTVHPQAEADGLVALLTQEFGVVFARASSIRKEKSLMRYALVLGSVAQVSLVRGKRGWRLAGALPDVHITHASGLHAFARMRKLIVRLVHGEEQNDFLFSTMVHAVRALASSDEERVPTIELLAVARMLYALGYLSAEAVSTTFFTHTEFTVATTEEAGRDRIKLLGAVNGALSASQL